MGSAKRTHEQRQTQWIIKLKFGGNAVAQDMTNRVMWGENLTLEEVLVTSFTVENRRDIKKMGFASAIVSMWPHDFGDENHQMLKLLDVDVINLSLTQMQWEVFASVRDTHPQARNTAEWNTRILCEFLLQRLCRLGDLYTH